MSIFLFLVMSNLPPSISILLLNGVFIVQIAIDVWYSKWPSHRCSRDAIDVCSEFKRWKRSRSSHDDYNPLDSTSPTKSKSSKMSWKRLRRMIEALPKSILENKLAKIVSFLLQFAGIVGLAIYVGVKSHGRHFNKVLYLVFAFPITLLVMSAIWSNKFQRWMACPQKVDNCNYTARYKSSKNDQLTS